MDRPGTPFLRERLGLFLALIAGVLLVFVGAKIHEVANEAGGDISKLSHERAAVDYAGKLQDTLVTLEKYRTVAVLQDPAEGSIDAARRNADQAIRVTSAFNAGPGAAIGVGHQWTTFLTDWKKVRGASGAQWNAQKVAARSLINVYSGLEDNSGLTYDPNVSAQNLADMTFAKIPSGINGVNQAAIISLGFIKDRQIALQRRLDLAIGLNSLISNFDLSTDDLKQTLDSEAALERSDRLNSNQAAKDATESTARGTRFVQLLRDHVRAAIVPTVNASDVRVERNATQAALLRTNTALLSELRENLQRRMSLEETRSNLYEIATIVGAVFLLGLILEIVRFAARGDREELRRAQEESARLSAELAREHAEKALALTEAQFRAVFDGAAVGIAILDQSGAVVDANSVFREHFGRDAALFLDGHRDEIQQILNGKRELFEFEQHYVPEGKDELWVDATISVVSDEKGAAQFAICMFRDITPIKRNERQMVHDMTHDSLTGLPNRVLFETQLRDRFNEAGTLLDSFFAVLFVDLDHFKDFNESLGHGAGDTVLQQVATRLRASLDPTDLVARLGSDEFSVLIRSLGDILHVESVARRILNNVCKPIQIGDRSVFAACSIGIAIGSATYERAEDVMRDANTAMSQAKSTGGSRYAVFDSNMHAKAERRLQLTTDLRLALQRNEFRLLYQPIVRIADGHLVGSEALLRWDHPVEGMILPGDFMPIAEQTGLAIPIGRFVFETACKQLSKWRDNWSASPEGPPFSMSVNVSAAEIFDSEFEHFVVSTCHDQGVDPREVTLEITESVVLDSNTRANLIFERLQGKGFKICIDDFGTGYSSLRYLQQFKIDSLKIDRSFVASSDGEIASEPIVRTLMTLAEAFDLHVVAEGVESQRQRDMLRQAGCRYAQGYYYSRPIAALEIANMYPDVLARKQTPATA